MNKDYSFEQLWKDLDDGYQIYYTYMGTRYLLSKLTKNCYSKEIVKFERKGTSSQDTNNNLKSCKRIASIYGGDRI